MICALIMAAGESRRMGVHKMVLPLGKRTVIAHIADQLRASAVDEIFVVVGHEAGHVTAALDSLPEREDPCPPITVVHNPDYKTGMLSSVRAGLRALPPRCTAVLVALGDQPSITARLVDQLIVEYRKIAPGILVPCFAGRRGHPLIFSTRYMDEILTRYDDAGLRGFLRAHPEDVSEMETPTDAVLTDMDYPEDYRRELDRFKNK